MPDHLIAHFKYLTISFVYHTSIKLEKIKEMKLLCDDVLIVFTTLF